MRPLATAAHRLAPFGTQFTWVPREQNKHADRILNDALDAEAGKPARKSNAPTAPSTPKPPALGKVSAISLFVDDVQQTKAFYQEVFGVPVVFEDDVSAALRFDDLVVNLLHVSEAAALVEPKPVAGPDTGSRFQLSIWVEDVDAICAELQQRGVRLLTGPVDRPWGMRVATFTDPAGHSWEIAQSVQD